MLKNDEVDYCTKCTVKPIVKEHLCEECYIVHNAWLKLGHKDLKAKKLAEQSYHKAHDLDGDNWHTLYESKL